MSTKSNRKTNFTTFADWCLHFDSLSEAARHTIEMVLRSANTSGCNRPLEQTNLKAEKTPPLQELLNRYIKPLQKRNRKAGKMSTPQNLLTRSNATNRIVSNLTCLTLNNNQIADVSPLSALTNLTELNLGGNQIADVSPLSALTNLTYLHLGGNQIADISPLKSLTNLTQLSLSNSQIADISPLKTLTNLTYLYLWNCRIEDISPLKALTNLTYLYFDNNQIADITPLKALTKLTYLHLSNNKIRDISPLVALTNLTYLYLHRNPIANISPLQSLNRLEDVRIYDGIYLPSQYLSPQHQWQAQWLLEEDNAELRRLLIEVIGYDRICQELQAMELDSWQEYTLIGIDADVDIEPIYLLKMTCPSTGRIHLLQVPPEVNSAREAIRWVNWGIDPEDFAVQT